MCRDWVFSFNHFEHAQKVNPYTHELKRMILDRLTFEKVLQRDTFKELEKLRELYNSFCKQYNYNNYANIDEWESYLNKKIAEYDFYIRAIQKGVFDKVACLHHYEKTDTGEYINISKDTFWRDPERYIQRF